MLKAIELSGFKSFADKTRFEFPAGITVIVGPNGSGKSNIVDAMKGVLGEQSAKSLRGKEMADVIFKGSSGANARKPANAATVTLILDNTDQRLTSGPSELHVTRRVYRSGEGEYLINGEPCRLKDIRGLFRGTGLGTDSYSLIEQGKVDRLLQASAKDRRAIFEEAAGISRFKAKKVEAERRLQRVDGNLVRLADIVEEVGARYRAVKNQATRAARYKEFTDRLFDLRTQVGCFDYRALSEKCDALTVQELPLREQAQELETAIQTGQFELEQLQLAADQVSDTLRLAQEALTQVRADLSHVLSQRELNEARRQDLQARIDQRVQQEASSSAQYEALSANLAEYSIQQTRLVQEVDIAAQTLALNQSRRAELANTLSQFQAEEQACRDDWGAKAKLLAETRDFAAKLRSQVAVWCQSQSRLGSQLEDASTKAVAEQKSVHRLRHDQERLQRDAESTDSALNSAQQAVDSLQRELEQVRNRIANTGSELAGVRQRAEVIEELERRWEGINAGARDILLQSRGATSGPCSSVLGLTADLICVNVQHAPIVDAALGSVSQYLVVSGNEFVDALSRGEVKVAGRVGVLSLHAPTSLGANWQLETPDHPDIVGPLDGLVQCDPKYTQFFKQLLHGTWIVKSLSAARRLRDTVSDQIRYVTLDGEVLEVDGVLLVGPKSSAMGLVSRRSELRSLHRQADQLQRHIDEWRLSESALSRELIAGQSQARELLHKNRQLASELARLQAETDAAEQRWQLWESQRLTCQAELDTAVAELNQTTVSLQRAELQADEIATVLAEREARIQELGIAQQETARQMSEIDIDIATAELRLKHAREQVAGLAQRQLDIERQIEELSANRQSLAQQLEQDRSTEIQIERAMNLAMEQIAVFENRRDELNCQIESARSAHALAEQNRRHLAEQLEQRRRELQDVANRRRENVLRLEALQSERSQLRQRMQEDFGIDVTAAAPSADTRLQIARQDVEQEINDLRQKVQTLGSVNMEALAELQELEGRYQSLDQQYQDLVAAKESLTRIIHRINGDSRRLFTETLDSIRANFQKLFRLTFGGGQADLILEEGVDILEAGVEIVATPPGKPKFNNSLLSGGEKALTAVSLLMAIFQYRPSPFCVLDEVDAPFDEANIGRFIDVLKSFLGWTKFVIVTHSKKTMTAATTLYGVTMQESGVSKRVSVRFEDVSDDGQISAEALRREDAPSAVA